MRNIFNYLAIIATALAGLACTEKTPEEIKPEEKPSFNIEIIDLHSSHCKVKVTPDNPDTYYFLGVATEDYLKTFGSLYEIETTVSNFIETEILMNQNTPVSEMLKKGVYEREVTGLQPEQRFIVFACYTDQTGAIISEVKHISETTPTVTASANQFEIEIDQVTATSAMLFITPSTDDDYVWLEFPEYVYEYMTMEELEEFLLKNYKPFFPLHTNSGEMVHSFDDKLEPDTEYMIIVFGYNGGSTTPLTTKKFRTLEPNDATDVTFSMEFGTMTPRSASITFKPSDNSVSYLAIVADEELLEKRGEKTGSFSLTPGLRHYACAVCVDKNGEYVSAVAIESFTAPSESATDTTVSASFKEYYDGDELAGLDAELYGDYAGWAVLPVRFTLGGSAADAIYTVYPVSVIEEEGATDDDIRELLLDDELLGEYNFHIESKVDIPALVRSGASPVSEF